MDSPEQNENELRLDSAWAEYMRNCDDGVIPDRDEFLQRFPEFADELSSLLRAADALEKMAGPKGEFATVQTTSSKDRGSWRQADSPSDHERGTESTLPLHFGGKFSSGLGSTDVTIGVANDSSGFSIDPAGQEGATEESLSSPKLPYHFGEYTLEKLLGRGGMGVVYRARQDHLDRIVAVKMIRSGALASEDEVQRFYSEARSAAKLDHPNIVMVYQCGELDGHHYFSMDYVPGTDLARVIDQGAVDPRHAARYVRDVARAIDYAHQRGVIHRDLKPANVLIDSDDQVHVTDFGLAKTVDKDSGLTKSGVALGTPSYMSPEQALGRSDQHVATTDVYSLGAILFALLTGKPPFKGTSVVQTVMQVIHRPAPSLRQLKPGIEEDLETIVAKCLHKQPAKRYQTAAELAGELERYLEGRPIEARPQNWLQKSYHWSLGIPLIGALAGYKVLDPTAGQRQAQRWILMLGLLLPLLAFSILGLSQWWSKQLPLRIRIASGESGGLYYSIGEKLAERIGDKTKHKSMVRATAGSIENSRLLMDRQCDLALLQASSVRSETIAVVAPLYYEAVHLLVPKGSTLESLEAIKRQQAKPKIWLGLPESGNHEAAEVILKMVGFGPEDYLAADGSWEMLEKGTDIDLAFVVIRAGHSRVRQLMEKTGYHLIPIEGATELALEEPTFRPLDVPRDAYPGLATSEIKTLATTAFLACRADAPDLLVKETLSALYDDGLIMPELISRQKAKLWRGLAYHHAAQQYFESNPEP